MSTAAVRAPQSPSPLAGWARQAWAVALYELQRLRHGRHRIARVVLVGLPVILCVLVALVRLATSRQGFTEPLLHGHEQRTTIAMELLFLARTFRFFTLPVVLYVSTAGLFANLYYAELADRTLHHVFLQPVRREVVTIGKYVAAVLTIVSVTLLAWTLATAVLLVIHGPGAAMGALFSADGLRQAFSYAAMILLASMAYGSLFLLIGALVRWPSIVMMVYWLWELLTLVLPQGFKRATIAHWVSSFMPMAVVPDNPVVTLGTPESRVLAVIVLLAFTVLCVALATWRARHIQAAYGASE